jgi:hypothetical protein
MYKDFIKFTVVQIFFTNKAEQVWSICVKPLSLISKMGNYSKFWNNFLYWYF